METQAQKPRRQRPKPVKLTEAAAARIAAIMAKAEGQYQGVRVGVTNGGCAGMSYTMDYAESQGPLDEMVEVAFTVSPRVRRIAAHDPHSLPVWEYFRQIFWSSGVDLPEEGFEDVMEEITVDSIELPAGEKAQMSTRSGEFITLRELRNEVGNDACRFFYVMRGNDQHLDFDMTLAKSRTNDNPVYYIQYAHARVASVLRQLASKGHAYDASVGMTNLGLLSTPHETALLTQLEIEGFVTALPGQKFQRAR